MEPVAALAASVVPRPSAAARLLSRIQVALQRMRQGIALIHDDPEIREAFRLANLAMVMQMRHYGLWSLILIMMFIKVLLLMCASLMAQSANVMLCD